MKELSIEEKARRYDEAIKRIENIKTGKCEITFMFTEGLFEHIFPELAESEDDKIRSIILDQMKHWHKDAIIENCNIDIEVSSKCISWLEKQGEQKPIDKIQLGKKYKCIASPRYSTFVKGFIYKPEDKFLCSLMNFCSDCFEPIEDVEQKPAEWSEEYNGEDYGIDSLYHAQRILEKTLGKVEGYQTDDGILAHQCAISAIKKLYEQKPWSEDDISTISRVISIVKWAAYSDHSHPVLNDEGATELVERLKSIKDKYTWKPSEREIQSIRDCALNKNIDADTRLVLDALYQDLLKLREE